MQIRNLIPWFPISVIIFYFVVILGSQYGFILSIYDMTDWLSSLYELYGLPALFIASILESIAYLGLYFPGSAVIVLAVAFSGGSVQEFAAIAAITVLANVFGSTISYYCGYYGRVKSKSTTPKLGIDQSNFVWFIFAHWHPNAIGLWFFKRGLSRQVITPWIFWVWPIMFCWGLFLAFIVYALREQVEENRATEVFVVLFLWLIVDVYLKYKKHG